MSRNTVESVSLASVAEVIQCCANIQKGQAAITGDYVLDALQKDRKIHAQLRNVLIYYPHIHRTNERPYAYSWDESKTNPMYNTHKTVKTLAAKKKTVNPHVAAFIAKKNGVDNVVASVTQEELAMAIFSSGLSEFLVPEQAASKLIKALSDNKALV